MTFPYDYYFENKDGVLVPSKKYEQSQRDDDFFDVMKWRIDRDRSNIIILVGEQGSGKSNTGLYLLDYCNKHYYNKKVDFKKMVFNSVKDFIYAFNDLKDCYVLLEEMGVELNSKDFRESSNRIFRDVVETFRIRHINLLITLPNLQDLDKSTRFLSHFIIKMEYPGYGVIFRKLSSFLTDKIRFLPVWTFENIPDMKKYNAELWTEYDNWHHKYIDNKHKEWKDEIDFKDTKKKYKRNWYKQREQGAGWS